MVPVCVHTLTLLYYKQTQNLLTKNTLTFRGGGVDPVNPPPLKCGPGNTSLAKVATAGTTFYGATSSSPRYNDDTIRNNGVVIARIITHWIVSVNCSTVRTTDLQNEIRGHLKLCELTAATRATSLTFAPKQNLSQTAVAQQGIMRPGQSMLGVPFQAQTFYQIVVVGMQCQCQFEFGAEKFRFPAWSAPGRAFYTDVNPLCIYDSIIERHSLQTEQTAFVLLHNDFSETKKNKKNHSV